MKLKFIVVALLLCFVITGCAKNATTDTQNPANDNLKPEEHFHNQIMRVVSVHENTFKYVFIPEEGVDHSVNIIGDNIDGLVEEFNEVKIECEKTGETLKVEVIGDVYDFKLLEVVWDEENNRFENGDLIKEYEQVQNSSIYINTYLPCGLPHQVIEWKNKDGKEFSMLLSQDGYGFSGSVIWSK